MKTTIYRVFDEADAAELAPFLRQNGAPTVRRDTMDAVRRMVYEKTGLREQKKKPLFLRPQVWAAAACVCLVVGALFASGVLPGGVHSDIEDPAISYHLVEDLYLRADFERILWGQQQDGDLAPNVPAEDPEESGGSCIINPTVRRDGLNVSLTLSDQLSMLSPDAPVAIGVTLLTAPSHPLMDHVYQGRSYSEMQHDYQESRNLLEKLTELKRLSSRYQSEPFESEDDIYTFWAKLYETAGEELAIKYFSGDKVSGRFDTNAISDDLSACEAKKLQLENALEACRRDWNAECAALPELERLQTEKGYYVVKNGSTYAIILPAGQFTAFAADMQALFGQENAQSVMFRLATRAELGMEEPADDAQIPVPDTSPTGPDVVEQETTFSQVATPAPEGSR